MTMMDEQVAVDLARLEADQATLVAQAERLAADYAAARASNDRMGAILLKDELDEVTAKRDAQRAVVEGERARLAEEEKARQLKGQLDAAAAADAASAVAEDKAAQEMTPAVQRALDAIVGAVAELAAAGERVRATQQARVQARGRLRNVCLVAGVTPPDEALPDVLDTVVRKLPPRRRQLLLAAVKGEGRGDLADRLAHLVRNPDGV